MSTREYILERTLADVKSHMKLRRPQRVCLDEFHDIYKNMPGNLNQTSREETLDAFREYKPHWSYGGGFPEVTCALATGVGKTLLMGAFMAYLYKAEESFNFLILAPRATIIDKLIRESHPYNPKYIFFDSSFVSQPIIYHAGNFESYNPQQLEFGGGPTIWIVSPQAIARSNGEDALRFHRKSEYLGASPYEYLSSLTDLVIFFDESHHLGNETDGIVPAWTQAVRNLSPRLLCAMTASPGPSANILHRYTLHDCLSEGIYTKSVRVVVETRPDTIPDDEWDRVTLSYALDRLAVKKDALSSYDDEKASVRPIALVCAKDTEHAEQVAEWLKDRLGEEAVLLVHSGRDESTYIESLLSVEEPSSKVQVIVNVFQLTEGWDVTNVYVIVPLRAMATMTGVIQTMGRGLRLPFGRRIEDAELDTLDVLCYGRETMNEIVDQALSEGFGNREDEEQYIDVTSKDGLDEQVARKTYRLQLVGDQQITFTLPMVDWKRPQVDLSHLKITTRQSSIPLAIDLSDPATIRNLEGKGGYEWSTFLSVVTSLTTKRKKAVGSLTSAAYIRKAVEAYLIETGLSEGDLVPYDPDLVARLCIDAIDSILLHTEPVYEAVEGDSNIVIHEFDITIPDTFSQELSNAKLDFKSWVPKCRGVPVAGWSRCLYKAVPFDSPDELHVAKIIDRSEDVEWWIRNLRDVFHLNTPSGTYSPDFLFLLRTEGKNVLLEVKGQHLAAGEDSISVIKAAAAEAWCESINAIGQEVWEHWFVIGGDAKGCETIGDLEQIAEDWRMTMS
jgi:superfamily II DNA or RNA helicase